MRMLFAALVLTGMAACSEADTRMAGDDPLADANDARGAQPAPDGVVPQTDDTTPSPLPSAPPEVVAPQTPQGEPPSILNPTDPTAPPPGSPPPVLPDSPPN
jgi:hypothetical protein